MKKGFSVFIAFTRPLLTHELYGKETLEDCRRDVKFRKWDCTETLVKKYYEATSIVLQKIAFIFSSPDPDTRTAQLIILVYAKNIPS